MKSYMWNFALLIYILSISNITAQTIKYVKILRGGSTTLPCGYARNSTFYITDYQWIINGFGYQNDSLTSMSNFRKYVVKDKSNDFYPLRIFNANLDDTGIYRCQLNVKVYGKFDNRFFYYKVQIIVPPKTLKYKMVDYDKNFVRIIPGQPNLIYAIQGQSISLICTTNASVPKPRLVWKLKRDSVVYKLDQQNTKTTIKLEPNMNDVNVSCEISNAADYLNSTLPSLDFNIKILYLKNLKVTKLNTDQWKNINDGEMVSTSCDARVTPKSTIQYKWKLKLFPSGKVLDLQSDNSDYLGQKKLSQRQQMTSKPPLSSNVLIFKAVREYHRAQLFCSVSATMSVSCPKEQLNYGECKPLRLQKISNNISILNILYPPVIQKPYESYTIDRMGQTVDLVCNAESNPPSHIRWYKTEVGTSRQIRSLKWYQDTRLTSLQETLQFTNVQHSSQNFRITVDTRDKLDIYICEAMYTRQQKVFKYVMVAEKEKPSVRIGRSQLSVKEGDAASLMCLFESWPKLTNYFISWKKVGDESQISSDKYRYIRNRGQLMGVQSKLYFTNVRSEDFGAYNCSIKFGSNSVYSIIQLKTKNTKLSIWIPIGLIAALFIIIIIMVIACCCKKWKVNNSSNKKGINNHPVPMQQVIYPSPTIDSSIEQELFLSRMNSLQSYPREGSINMPQNRCFIFNTKQDMMSKLSCGDFKHMQTDEKLMKQGNERSWDSGVCPDELVMGSSGGICRNGGVLRPPQLPPLPAPPPGGMGNPPKASSLPYCVSANAASPFSTLASSNASAGSNRYLVQMNPGPHVLSMPPTLMHPINGGSQQTQSDQLSDTNTVSINGHSNCMNNNSNNNNDPVNTVSTFINSPSSQQVCYPDNVSTNSSSAGLVTMIHNPNTQQSFVCIPVEEYQNQLRFFRENSGQMSNHENGSLSNVSGILRPINQPNVNISSNLQNNDNSNNSNNKDKSINNSINNINNVPAPPHSINSVTSAESTNK